MVIKDIWLPEAIIVIFLALPFIRSFIKHNHRPRAVLSPDGFSLLPLIALGITVGIFPAYGFRFECLPMLVFALVINIANLISVRRDNSYNRRSSPYSVIVLIFLTAAAIPMFVFAPRVYPVFEEDAEPLVQKLGDFNENYYMRIFRPPDSADFTGNAGRPIIFLVPPEMGSVASVDLVSRQLVEYGYTVVTYSRRGYDTPLIDESGQTRIASPGKLARYWHIFRRAGDFSKVNSQGYTLEVERRADILFLLPHLPALLGRAGLGDMPPLLLVGYGAGGSALAYLAGEEGFATRYGNVLGVVAIESRLWSSYQEESRPVFSIPANAGMALRYWSAFTGWLSELPPLRVNRTGPLPGERFSGGVPVMYLVSGRALDTRRGRRPYRAIFDTLRLGAGPTALVAVESAGPLDYQDFPFTQPFLSFLLPGLSGTRQSNNPVNDTAGIIGNYASFLLGRTSRQTIQGGLHIESRGLPAFWL